MTASARRREGFIIEMEKKFFGKISFRSEPAMHASSSKIINGHHQRGAGQFRTRLALTEPG